jgi:hypothetical protein
MARSGVPVPIGSEALVTQVRASPLELDQHRGRDAEEAGQEKGRPMTAKRDHVTASDDGDEERRREEEAVEEDVARGELLEGRLGEEERAPPEGARQRQCQGGFPVAICRDAGRGGSKRRSEEDRARHPGRFLDPWARRVARRILRAAIARLGPPVGTADVAVDGDEAVGEMVEDGA